MSEPFEEGATRLENGMTLPYVWSSLHVNAAMELKLASDPRFTREVNRFTGELVRIVEALKDVDAERWLALCQAAGMTVFGVVGLSWCKGATTKMLWSAWDETPYDLVPGAESERPAGLLNPDLMPQTSVLSEIVAACGKNGRRATLAIAALKVPLEIDVDEGVLNDIEPKELKAFVLDRHVKMAAD